MSIFTDVKEAVSCKDAAIFYGLKVTRNNMCRCPFHNDKNPSMKIDRRYFCFGCCATGDVIDFVGNLYNLNPKEAAVKLAEDFGIDTSVNAANGPNTSSQVHRQETDAIKMYNEQKQFKELVDICINWLFSFKEYWINEKDANLPDPDEEWSDRFCLALENIAMADSMLDIFILGTEDEKHRLIQYMEDKTNGN